jgi:hypothetical protein
MSYQFFRGLGDDKGKDIDVKMGNCAKLAAHGDLTTGDGRKNAAKNGASCAANAYCAAYGIPPGPCGAVAGAIVGAVADVLDDIFGVSHPIDCNTVHSFDPCNFCEQMRAGGAPFHNTPACQDYLDHAGERMRAAAELRACAPLHEQYLRQQNASIKAVDDARRAHPEVKPPTAMYKGALTPINSWAELVAAGAMDLFPPPGWNGSPSSLPPNTVPYNVCSFPPAVAVQRLADATNALLGATPRVLLRYTAVVREHEHLVGHAQKQSETIRNTALLVAGAAALGLVLWRTR